MKINYDKLATRVKQTSDGELAKNHGITCGGRCVVFYDEDALYHVECEKCGWLVSFLTTSHDRAIKLWNDMPDAIGHPGFHSMR